VKEESADTPSTTSLKSPTNFSSEYHFYAQQALILASVGGLAGAHDGNSKEDEKSEEALVPIGRSLFISLKITTWEEDENVILEVGWAAIWWQEKLEVVAKDEGSRYEEMRDFGHHM